MTFLIITIILSLAIINFYIVKEELHEAKNFKEVLLAFISIKKKKLPLLAALAAAIVVCTVVGLTQKQAAYITLTKTVVIIMFLGPIALIDREKNIIPNFFIAALIGLRVLIYIVELVLNFQGTLNVFVSDSIAGIAVGLFFLIGGLVIKNSVGMGDIKLVFVIGIYQGLNGTVSSIFFSLLVSFFIAVFLLATKKKSRKDYIPFAPSVFLGILISTLLIQM